MMSPISAGRVDWRGTGALWRSRTIWCGDGRCCSSRSRCGTGRPLDRNDRHSCIRGAPFETLFKFVVFVHFEDQLGQELESVGDVLRDEEVELSNPECWCHLSGCHREG